MAAYVGCSLVGYLVVVLCLLREEGLVVRLPKRDR